MTFTLDTSGRITIPAADKWELASADTYAWSDLSPFAQGYVEAVLRSFGDIPIIRRRGPGERPMLRSMIMEYRAAAFSDLSPEALARIMEDCRAMLSGLLIDKGAGGGREAWEQRQTGWKNWGPACRKDFPPLHVILNDEGKVTFQDQGQ